MGLFNMSAGQGMGQPGQPMPTPFDPMQGQQSPSLFNFSTPQAISNPVAAKPKHNWAGIASSFLAGVTGRPDGYMASVEERRKAALEDAHAQRQQAAEYAQFVQKERYKAENPGPKEPHYFQDNSGNQMAIGPDGAPVEVYHDPLQYKLVPNGMGGVVPVNLSALMNGGGGQVGAPAPPHVTFTPMDGGQTHPASGNFPRR